MRKGYELQMDVQGFIAKWQGITGGAERANYGVFLTDFCTAMGLETPQPASKGELGDYQFDGPLEGGSELGNKGFMDLYKRGCFILGRVLIK